MISIGINKFNGYDDMITP